MSSFYNKEKKAMAITYTNVSKAWADYLDKMAVKQGVSVSVLIMRAIHNEIYCQNAFEADYTLPEKVKDENTEESKLLYAYLSKYPGLNLEHLVLQRLDLGISTREQVLTAYKHLLDIEMIEEYEPMTYKKNQSRDYKLVRIKADKRLKESKVNHRKIVSEKGPLDE